MKVIKILGGIIQILLLLIIGLTLGIVFLARQQGLFGLYAFVVQSGSMTPAIPAGSLVIVSPQSQYFENDIITYYTNDQNGARQKLPTTHRIIELVKGQNLGFKTQGDANNSPDPFITPAKNVIGKVIFHLPYFGRFTAFAKSKNGLIFLIVAPAVLLVYTELNTLITETKKIFQKKQPK